MLLMDVFESGHFKEYRNNDLISLYKKYFEELSDQRKELNRYIRRHLRKNDFDNYYLPEMFAIEKEIVKAQNRFIDEILERSESNKYVFMSHKHDDLTDVLDIACFLSDTYHIGCYIDCFDKRQPLKTSVQTAIRIKKVIDDSHRFLFVGTSGAFESKWCNWELGYGDSKKHQNGQNHLAFWAMQNTAIKQGNYKGYEYMEMYPFIVYQPNAENSDSHGYSVRIKDGLVEKFMPLADWLA